MKKSTFLTNFFNPYPLTTSFWGIVRIGLLVGTFVFIFLFAFQPFGLSTFNENKSLIICGYGAIAFLVSTSSSLFISHYFKESKWTNFHQIIFYLFLLVALSIANYFYTKTILEQIELNLLNFTFYTISVAIFPLTFITLFFQNQQDKKYKLESTKVNKALLNSETQFQPLKDELSIKMVSGAFTTIKLASILFIESEGNYLLINHLSGGVMMVTKSRGTIKNITAELNPVFQKTHRAFIVNTQSIIEAKGNAQGLKLTIKDCAIEIPVSRNFVQHFRSYLEN